MASLRSPSGPKTRWKASIASGSIGSAPLIMCRTLFSERAGRSLGASASHLRAVSAYANEGACVCVPLCCASVLTHSEGRLMNEKGDM